MIIEHPYRSGWRLLDPEKPLEKTDRFNRFEVTVPAKKTVAFKVVETRGIWDSIAVTNLTPDDIFVYSQKKYLDPKQVELIHIGLVNQ